MFAAASYNFINDSGLSNTGTKAGYNLSTPTPEFIAGRIVQLILSFIGVLFLAFMIYAGVTWMTAQGDEKKVEKAKDLLTESIVGLIISLAAYAISYFIIQYFSSTSLSTY